MDDLFGISLNLIMWVLLALLALALATVAIVAWRNTVMFKIGIRNIPRRRSQTVLIVVGLMLSTIIISAAFTMGDTVDQSLSSEVYSILGSMDEVIQVSAPGEDEISFDDAGEAFTRPDTFASSEIQPLVASLSADPLVDYVLPAYSSTAVAVNTEERLSSPLFNIVGLDPQQTAGLPDIEDLQGNKLELSALGNNEIYVTRSGADELNLQAGDSLQLTTFGQARTFSVKAIVKDRRLAGSGGISIQREGAVLPLTVAQSLFNAPGQLTMIIVSNRGDAREGYKHVDQMEATIDNLLITSGFNDAQGTRLTIQTVKATGVEISEFNANIFTTFFLALGLFSIGAGVMLIFMIFVMLAAERKSEMGMARAVGTKRSDIVQTFLSEGMAYNLLAAAVGTGLGVLVAFLIARLMAGIFSSENINISGYVTLRSLIISYALGVVLTFFTVVFSSWRVSVLNIVRAIRDIPEPPAQRPAWGSRGLLSIVRDLFFKPADRQGWIRRGLIALGLVLLIFSTGSGLLPLTLIGVLLIGAAFFSYAWSQKSLSAPFRVGLFLLISLTGPVSLLVAVFMVFQAGPLFMIASLPLMLLGASEDLAFPLLFGLSLLPLGLAMTLRSFGGNERLLYTATGLFMIYIWEFDAWDSGITYDGKGLTQTIFGEFNGDIEMFFLSGVMVTLAATFLVVYNSDIVLAPLSAMGRVLGKLLPSIKMAVAYPLANKTRTGLTMAMFCLVIFALTVMSSMNHNFNRLYLSDRSLGGWDITVEENPNNPIQDLGASLRQVNSPVLDDIDAVGSVAIKAESNVLVCQPTADNSCNASLEPGALSAGEKVAFNEYIVWGNDPAMLSDSGISLQSRAQGYADDKAVWAAVASQPGLAVVDSAAIVGDFEAAIIEGVSADQTSFEPVTLVVGDKITRQTITVQVIGIIETGASLSYAGLHVSEPTFAAAFAEPDFNRYFVRTRDGANNVNAAREIESALLSTGAQAESLRKQIDDLTATQSNFFLLMQGFMGLGLLVGVAAVGVIAFRTVVERRQQIGMLRALGYTRGMVGLTFLIESAFIALMGVMSGIVFALLLTRQIISEEFANQGVNTFSIPWEQIALIGGLAFGFALLMTLIPSRQAANIPIAQALRYE